MGHNQHGAVVHEPDVEGDHVLRSGHRRYGPLEHCRRLEVFGSHQGVLGLGPPVAPEAEEGALGQRPALGLDQSLVDPRRRLVGHRHSPQLGFLERLLIDPVRPVTRSAGRGNDDAHRARDLRERAGQCLVELAGLAGVLPLAELVEHEPRRAQAVRTGVVGRQDLDAGTASRCTALSDCTSTMPARSDRST